MRKVMMNWDTLTPNERSIMRYVFPFYGFMSHILRYAFNYPIDHPFRASILSNFARNEVNDYGTGLPEKFLNNFFFGHPNAQGMTNSLNLKPFNPFRDVANYFTLAGFAGATNPIFTTIAQQLGIDTTTGGPDLYPHLQYNKDTGRLGATSPNILQSLLENTLPQSRVLTSLLNGSEFRQLSRTSPSSARSLVLSDLGIPQLIQPVNIPAEVSKAELARERSQSLAMSSALRTGNDTSALRYPLLAPLIGQIRTLQGQGQLAAYQPQVAAPNMLQVAQQGLLSNLGI
jgi:hypothetical protein